MRARGFEELEGIASAKIARYHPLAVGIHPATPSVATSFLLGRPNSRAKAVRLEHNDTLFHQGDAAVIRGVSRCGLAYGLYAKDRLDAVPGSLGRPFRFGCRHAPSHLGLGKLYRRTGKPEQAHEHLTTATSMYREMDMRFWLEQAEAELKVLK